MLMSTLSVVMRTVTADDAADRFVFFSKKHINGIL
jgi:hypothetical protein